MKEFTDEQCKRIDSAVAQIQDLVCEAGIKAGVLRLACAGILIQDAEVLSKCATVEGVDLFNEFNVLCRGYAGFVLNAQETCSAHRLLDPEGAAIATEKARKMVEEL